MINDELKWMEYTINLSKQSPSSDLRIGVVIVSDKNELLCSTFSGEHANVCWTHVIIKKLRNLKLTCAHSIYLTINTLNQSSSFDLQELISEVSFNKIFVGLPDPRLAHYMDKDPILTKNNIKRYPDHLQHKIINQNYEFFSKSSQCIKNSPYYSMNRISNLVIENLKMDGLIISEDELKANSKEYLLVSLICKKYNLKEKIAKKTVQNAISKAFGNKYGSYKYDNDSRSIGLEWKSNFMFVYEKSTGKKLSDNNILNIGVGSGIEAMDLFCGCNCTTFVDIAPMGLENIKKHNHLVKTVVSCASNLFSIPDNSHDIYISLRTYNSSFFDIKKALREARRVLKPHSVLIISVANGFLFPERQCIIPGLIVPRTNFIDIYRGMDMINLIQTECNELGFNNFYKLPTETEIFLSAVSS